MRKAHGSMLLLILLTTLLLPASIRAATATVTVDMAANNGTPTYRATGFLYGLTNDASQPPADKFDALKPQQMRCGNVVYEDDNVTNRPLPARAAIAKAYHDRITAIGGQYHLCVADMFFGSGTDQYVKNGRYPGEDGDWTLWEAQIADLAQYMINNNMTDSYIDIWNEPDGILWPSDSTRQAQYLEAWKRAYRTFRQYIPNSKFTGPSMKSYDANYLGPWLDYVKANNVVPNLVTWHFGDPASDAPNVRNLLAARGITVDGLMVNEYVYNCCGQNQENPGNTAWLFARLERGQVPGIHAIWSQTNSPAYDEETNDGTLGHIMIKSGANYLRRGQWWAYKRYADITGTLVGVTPGGDIDGVAGKDASQNTARILLGNRGGTNGTVDVAITNLDQAAVINSGYVRAVVEQIPHNGNNEVSSPTVIQDQSFAVVNNQITISLPWNNSLDAYAITLTPGTPAPSAGGQTVFTTQTPAIASYNEGTSYEMGMKFQANTAGQITAIRFWKASGETGTHTGRIWSSSGTQLASVTFSSESGSGWQQATLSTPLLISANTTYVVSTNINTNYAVTVSDLQSAVTNGNLRSVADGANGVFGSSGSFPNSSYSNSNYFRDVVFAPSS